jgi:hypothetical protein
MAKEAIPDTEEVAENFMFFISEEQRNYSMTFSPKNQKNSTF